MNALTVYQPWASLIMAGAKPFEFRKRATPSSIIGKPIVIHASVKPIDRQMVKALMKADRDSPTWRESGLKWEDAMEVLKRAMYTHRATGDGLVDVTKHGDLPWGCGLGTVRFGEGVPAHLIAELGDSDRIDHHQWGWPISDIQPFPEPIEARGKQGFWPWNPGADMVTF